MTGDRKGDWADEDDQAGEPLKPFLKSFGLPIEVVLRALVLLLPAYRKSFVPLTKNLGDLGFNLDLDMGMKERYELKDDGI